MVTRLSWTPTPRQPLSSTRSLAAITEVKVRELIKARSQSELFVFYLYLLYARACMPFKIAINVLTGTYTLIIIVDES